MQLATRPWITAGVALMAAGAIIVSPVKPAIPDIEVAALQLIASPEGIDPITAIEDVFKLAQTNSVALDDHFSPVPLPTLQQVIADLLDGKQIDVQAATNAAVTPFLPASGLPPGDMPPPYLYSSLDPLHTLAYTVIHGMLTSPDLQSLLAFTASPLSGVLLGDVGPILDPSLALENSIQDALTAPDPQSALDDLLNIPANIADATLNGEFLDGTAPEINILPLLSLLPTGTLPPDVDITSLDLVLGGLLSPGSSLLNGISATISGLPVSLTGNAVGPIGSSIELDQAIATALGFSFPTPAMDTVSPLGDLLSTFTTALDGDLSTALTGLSTDVSPVLTDSLGNLASLF
jgi:hypothetical protein